MALDEGLQLRPLHGGGQDPAVAAPVAAEVDQQELARGLGAGPGLGHLGVGVGGLVVGIGQGRLELREAVDADLGRGGRRGSRRSGEDEAKYESRSSKFTDHLGFRITAGP